MFAQDVIVLGLNVTLEGTWQVSTSLRRLGAVFESHGACRGNGARIWFARLYEIYRAAVSIVRDPEYSIGP